MNTTIPQVSAAMSSRALRALSAPIFVLGIEWIVSATNKLTGNFVATFPAYTSGLQASHIFLPGLSLLVRFPIAAAWLAIVTETGLGIALVLASLFFLRGTNRVAEMVGGTALAVSAVVAVGLWLIVGHPPFWVTGNGYGSAWSVEFFLVCISAALALATAVADPDATLFMRAKRLLHS
jgi:uncharacterized membrane protein YphA (DoxX/SURF4 family)